MTDRPGNMMRKNAGPDWIYANRCCVNSEWDEKQELTDDHATGGCESEEEKSRQAWIHQVRRVGSYLSTLKRTGVVVERSSIHPCWSLDDAGPALGLAPRNGSSGGAFADDIDGGFGQKLGKHHSLRPPTANDNSPALFISTAYLNLQYHTHLSQRLLSIRTDQSRRKAYLCRGRISIASLSGGVVHLPLHKS